VYLIFRWNEDLSLVQLDGSGDEHLRTGISRDLSLWVLQLPNINGFSTVEFGVAIGHLQEPTVGIPQEAPVSQVKVC